jgi:tRNA pseudouridine38-40 synthase
LSTKNGIRQTADPAREVEFSSNTDEKPDVRREGDLIEIVTCARSFLHNQVRSMAGSLEHIGSGKWSAKDLREALEARERARCGQVAPPHGLYLVSVDY